MVGISKALFSPNKKYVIFPIKQWRAFFFFFYCGTPWTFLITLFNQKAGGWRVYILLSNCQIKRFYYRWVFRCLGSVSQIDFRNIRFVFKIDILAKILWNGIIFVIYFRFSNILQLFVVSFDINTYNFTVGGRGVVKGSISFVSRYCSYFRNFTMSQRLGFLATEAFKVLVFLMNQKANKQSVICALTGFQKKRLISIKQKTFSVRFQKYAILSVKTAILTQKLIYVAFYFFLHDISSMFYYCIFVFGLQKYTNCFPCQE